MRKENEAKSEENRYKETPKKRLLALNPKEKITKNKYLVTPKIQLSRSSPSKSNTLNKNSSSQLINTVPYANLAPMRRKSTESKKMNPFNKGK